MRLKIQKDELNELHPDDIQISDRKFQSERITEQGLVQELE